MTLWLVRSPCAPNWFHDECRNAHRGCPERPDRCRVFHAHRPSVCAAPSRENQPIGVSLCTDKDAAEVHFVTEGIERSVSVSRYMAQLPSKEQLRQRLQEERLLLEGKTNEALNA